MFACSVTWVAVVSQSRDKAQLGAALTKAHLEGLGLRFLDTQRIALGCHWLSGITLNPQSVGYAIRANGDATCISQCMACYHSVGSGRTYFLYKFHYVANKRKCTLLS
ncbi:hypothetical protein CEXT_95581 [Caerostris extrusa]|uniref:Uncharacterized protein n=1 Tax=Caerostris extrusa TaxID=172846 RepID=A0AAV4VH14_CAEEX|nr:hypothetical protein CEXT_95581 [Caerostris extrusa]